MNRAMIRLARPASVQAVHGKPSEGQRGRLGPLGGAARWAASIAASLLVAGGALAAEPAKKVDLAKGQQIAGQVCAACHGADGNAPTAANPKLAGQHADYLYKQLVNFVPKQGAKEAERANAIMMGMAATLSDDDKRNVSAYYASQAKKPSAARSKELVELGQKIYRGGIPEKQVPSCSGCHGPSGAGIPAQYPRMAGQWAEYTESQLVQFRAGQRNNSAQMTAISARLSDREIKAVSDYIAGLR
jgi:cbb3-type cytochrome c oxidase subunit III